MSGPLTIIDYGVGNVASIANMLKKAGFESVLSGDPATIRSANKLILPGVGSFDNAAVKRSVRDVLRPLFWLLSKLKRVPARFWAKFCAPSS
jgi:glutamine amidotransferase